MPRLSRSRVISIRQSLVFGAGGAIVLYVGLRGASGWHTPINLRPHDQLYSLSRWPLADMPALDLLALWFYLSVSWYIFDRYERSSRVRWWTRIAGLLIWLLCFVNAVVVILEGWLVSFALIPAELLWTAQAIGMFGICALGLAALAAMVYGVYRAGCWARSRGLLRQHLPLPGARTKLLTFWSAADRVEPEDFHDPGRPELHPSAVNHFRLAA